MRKCCRTKHAYFVCLCYAIQSHFCNFQCENGIYVCQITRMGLSGYRLLLAFCGPTDWFAMTSYSTRFVLYVFPDDGSINLMLLVQKLQQFFLTLISESRLCVSLSKCRAEVFDKAHKRTLNRSRTNLIQNYLQFSWTYWLLSLTLGARQLHLALLTTAASDKLSPVRLWWQGLVKQIAPIMIGVYE
jgi:hypothetical protein